MAVLAIPLLLQLSAACAGDLVPDARMIAHAQVESGLNPNAIGDNATGRHYFPATAAEAVEIARGLLAQRHSIDAGIMQVNNANWLTLGLSVESAFDPQRNVCAGKAVIAEAYAIERRVSCRYNAGRPDCGSNYPDKIEAVMARALPPAEASALAPIAVRVISRPAAGRPPAWDVYAVAIARHASSKE